MYSEMFALSKRFPCFNIPQEITILVYRWESSWIDIDKDEISLCQSKKGYFLKGRPVREPKQPRLTQNNNEIKFIPVSEKWVTSLLKRLEHTMITAFPPPCTCADGSFQELEISNRGGKAHYRWWPGDLPEGWEKLNKIAMEIHDKFYHKSLHSILSDKLYALKQKLNVCKL